VPLKKNVLHLISSFDQGGSERQAIQVARFMHQRGRYGVRLACLERRGVLLDEAMRIGIGEIPEYKLTSFHDVNAFIQLRRFARFLRQRSIDVVQSYDFYTNVFGMAGAALARVPVRIAARRETDGLRTGPQKWVERRAFQLAQSIVVNANAVGEELRRDGVPPRKIRTVYNGMDTIRVARQNGFHRGEILHLFNLPAEHESRRFVTLIANMRHAMKDQATFLRAARRVRAQVPEAAFILAGEGELLDETRRLAAQLGLEGDAFFIGRCAKVSELLSISDIGVLSSKGVEGLSNSILEYMAAARPVVATDVGGAREAIVEGETGYIVPPEDDETMARRIVSLLQEPERARTMGESGRRVVKEKFSCEAQVERLENLYDELLATAKPSAPRNDSQV
jgi:L-malate glycosyltransferase